MRDPRLADIRTRGPALVLLLSLAAALGSGLVLGCGDPPPPRVVLVTLAPVPPGGPEAEALRGLAAPGAWFERFYAAAPSTDAAVASMLTGRHPWDHGVLRPGDPLPRGVPTVAGALARRSVATAAAARGDWTARGFTRGFDRLARDEDPIGGALALLDELEAPGGTDRGTPGAAGQLLWIHLDDSVGDPAGDLVGDLGPLLDRLRTEAGRFETHLVIASTHGVAPGGANGPQRLLSSVHAPLLLLSPRVDDGAAGSPRRDVAGSVDVARTLLSLAGVRYPPAPWSNGRDLSAWAADPSLDPGAGSGVRPAAFGMLRPPLGEAGRPLFYALDRGGGFYAGNASGLVAAPDDARRNALEEVSAYFRGLERRVTSKLESPPAPSPPGPPPPPAAGPAPP